MNFREKDYFEIDGATISPVSVTMNFTAVVALGMRQPDDARLRPATRLRVFDGDAPVLFKILDCLNKTVLAHAESVHRVSIFLNRGHDVCEDPDSVVRCFPQALNYPSTQIVKHELLK
jgi:hypothetical protein